MIDNYCQTTFGGLIFNQNNILHMHPYATEPPHMHFQNMHLLSLK